MKPVIIGAGLAGLTVALSLAPLPVILLSPKKLGDDCASAWAQGGIAAAIGSDDSATLHAEDTMAAGAGLCDAEVVKAVTDDGGKIIEFLLSKGVPFDDDKGTLRLGLEAAHRRRRIVHAADQTGAAIVTALVKAVRATPSIDIIEDALAEQLPTQDGKISGVVMVRNGVASTLPTHQVVLATGGAGALWLETSNPLGSWGKGLSLAAQAGAVLGDLEFMQFHPTAIDIGRDPMPLASEALRGEGCTLINDDGERFVEELQPRDIVARAIWAQRSVGKKTFLDARKALGKNFAKRFPTVNTSCLSAGIDPATTPIPVSPAAHYHMGGVVTDLHGRTNIEGLWACGEMASTGLHGANRLASNSLLEAASFGLRVAEDIAGKNQPSTMHQTSPVPKLPEAAHDAKIIRSIMSKYVGVLRHAEGLQKACAQLAELAPHSDMALVGLLIAYSALQREESRGSHRRTDWPAADAAWQRHQHIKLADIRTLLEPAAQRRANGA